MSRSDRWSDRVERPSQFSLERRGNDATKTNDYSRSLNSGSRLSRRRLQELTGQLSERDQAVLGALARVRVLSGSQLERLAFAEVAHSARSRVRRRVLARLVELRLVTTLDRRVGGVRAGSAGLVYALTAGGWRLRDLGSGATARRRSPHTPGQLFLEHALAISGVHVDLVEAAHAHQGALIEVFDVEADARWQTDSGEWLRPDALVVLSSGSVEDVWWLEVDRGTESLPRVSRMLARYLEFAGSGEIGPRGVVPRVLVTVPDAKRRSNIQRLVDRAPEPASELFVVCLEQDAVERMLAELTGGEIRPPP